MLGSQLLCLPGRHSYGAPLACTGGGRSKSVLMPTELQLGRNQASGLIVCSIDKAQEIGLDWWKYDHHLAPGRNRDQAENDALREQVRLLERKLETVTRTAPARRSTPRR